MKNNYYIFLMILFGMIVSCSDDWLDPKPLSIFVPENIYVDKDGLDAVLLTCRKNIRSEYYGGPSVFDNELISTDCFVSGNKSNTATHNFFTQVLPTSSSLHDYNDNWDQAYNQIRNANVVISRIDQPEWMNENDKNEILAEAFFHRAYWYYRLVHQFGDVPFINKEYIEPKIDFYTHSRWTIIDKIQQDLEFAVQWLPEKVDPGKINRAAGNHLLTKVYLANSNFDGAISSSSAIIDDGIHFLMTERFGKYASDDNYNIIWDLHQKENKSISSNTEGLLVVQDKYGYPDAEVSGGTQAMRNYVPTWWHNQYLKDADGRAACSDARGNFQIIKLGRGVGYARPTNYTSYEIWKNCGDDLRHDTVVNWFPPEKMVVNNPASRFYGQPLTTEYTNPVDTFQSWFPFPYYKVYVEDEMVPDQPNGGHSDWYVFRLAETYLLRAEAYFWKKEAAKAALDINKVRNRANAPLIEEGDVTIEFILDERIRELFAESPRKTELTRISYIMAKNNLNGYTLDNFHESSYWWDRVQEKNNFYNIGFSWGEHEFRIGSFHVLWPIPQDVIDDNQGGIINQNIGYPGSENNIPAETEIIE